MKKTILLIASICIVTFAFAQNERYLHGMQKAFIVLQEADSAVDVEALFAHDLEQDASWYIKSTFS